jgi:hypothetical protein
MHTTRYHELYQDHVCSCMLRVARELFALLPIETLLLTARATIVDPRTGNIGEQPVLSVALPRDGVVKLNFEWLDPSDAIESFYHRGDFKASRKAGAFAPITPITPADIALGSSESSALADLRKEAETIHHELTSALSALPRIPASHP